MKKLLIFNSGSHLYGSERGLLNLVKALNGRYEVTVVLPGCGPLVEYLKSAGVRVKIFPLSILTLSWSPFGYLEFSFLFGIDFIYFLIYILTKKVDILYSNNALVLFPSLIACLLRKKHIWHIREFFPFPCVNRGIAWLSEITGSAVICQSKNIRDTVFPEGLSKPVTVIYEGISVNNRISAYADIPEVPKDAVIFTMVSRIHPSKGQYELVKLMYEVGKVSQRKFCLLFAGDIAPKNVRNRIYKRKIDKFIKENNMTGNIVLLGFREDVSSILNVADICVFPFQRNEPFGLAFLEALVYGKRILVTMNPGSKEIIEAFGGACAGLSLGSLVRELERGKLPSGKISIPELFSFDKYKRDISSYLQNT